MDNNSDPYSRGQGDPEGDGGMSKTKLRTSHFPTSINGSGTRKARVAVLASGRGSDLQAIIDSIEAGEVSYEISTVICNRENALAIERAKKHSIPYVLIDHRGKERSSFDMEMHEVLIGSETDLVVLAGFMRILSPGFVDLWRNRIINIHPALLPSFPGANAHRDALQYGVKVTGLTIHFVDEEMDSGPIIFQHPVEVRDDDTEDTLSMRVLEMEHYWYPRIIDRIVQGKVHRSGRKVTITK